MEKVKPAGTNKLGMESEISLVVNPPNGKISAKIFTKTIIIKADTLIACKRVIFTQFIVNYLNTTLDEFALTANK